MNLLEKAQASEKHAAEALQCMKLINSLRNSCEDAQITIQGDNPNSEFPELKISINVEAEFSEWQDGVFEGASLLDALTKADNARSEFEKSAQNLPT